MAQVDGRHVAESDLAHCNGTMSRQPRRFGHESSIRHPVVWLSALAIHLFVVFVSFDLAPERVPQCETWGLALRMLQLPAIAAQGWLSVAGRRERPNGAHS